MGAYSPGGLSLGLRGKGAGPSESELVSVLPSLRGDRGPKWRASPASLGGFPGSLAPPAQETPERCQPRASGRRSWAAECTETLPWVPATDSSQETEGRARPGAPVPNPAQHRVEGLLGEAALLSVLLPPGKAVTKIEWEFQAGNVPEVRAIADFIKGNFERPDPEDRFKQRLEKVNETTLRIKGLQGEDGGVYKAHVRFTSTEMEEQTFLLVVSDKREHGQWWTKLLLMVSFIILISYTLIWLLKGPISLLFKKIISRKRRPASQSCL
ncbi:uncharacterized protein LOC143842433 [Paroedura picta]|uniref:uncharacterized protein LOC143842433 n=1 Tax=Paroedura picta TaxID=143630 RepID=UPI0040570148